MATRGERVTEARAGMRWCNNILCEVLNNHGGVIGAAAAEALHAAIRAIADADDAVRALPSTTEPKR